MIRIFVALLSLLVLAGTVQAQFTPVPFRSFILGLPQATTVSPNDLLYLNQGGQNKTITEGKLPIGNPGVTSYLVTGGTTGRTDQNRWVDNWTEAPEIGVDCTGVADSTTAIQTWATAHTAGGGHLMFPLGCQVVISSTITITDGINVTFSAATQPGQGPGATLIWKGTNGSTACGSNLASCVYMFDLEHTDHPVFENLAFLANEAVSGWIGDNCPDGFIKFDGNPGVHIGTAGHVLNSTFSNNCVNPNFVAINLSPTAVNNQENYVFLDNLITCSVKDIGLLSHDGVSNGTTTLTAASGPFAANLVGHRIRVSRSGTEFDTTIAAFVSSTQVTLAAAVPFSDTALTLHNDQGYGIGLRIGANQNSLQHVINKIQTQFCEAGIWQVSGNSQIVQPTGDDNDFGIFIGGFTAQNTYIDYNAAESNYYDIYIGSGITTPVSIEHARWSNGNQSGVGYVALANQVRVMDSFPDFGPQSANSNFITPAFSYKINSIGTVVGGAGYTTGTYTNVPLLATQSVVGTVGPTSGVGHDFGIQGTVVVAGGVVTTVTITTPGTFISFPLPMTSGFFSGGNIVTYSLTATPANIGGTGTGFSVPITSFVTNTIGSGPGALNLLSGSNNWSVGNWTYSQTGFPTFGSNARIVSVNDNFDFNTQPATNVTVCNAGGGSITGANTCNQISNTVNSGLALDVVSHGNVGGQNGSVVGVRNEGDISQSAGTSSFTGFQNIPTTGRESDYWMGFENAAAALNASHTPNASYGFMARQMTSVGGALPNVYAYYAEGQKITNVTTGWGFYSAGATDNNFLAGNLMLGNNGLTVPAAGLGLAKIAADGVAPGAAGGKIELVCGTNAGSAKLIAYAGTSATPVTILDNIGSGVTGC